MGTVRFMAIRDADCPVFSEKYKIVSFSKLR